MCLAAGVTVALFFAVDPAAGDATEDARTGRAGIIDFVALGDSFSSGEGNPPFLGGDCHRSTQAWPRLLSRRSERLRLNANWACSGATIAALTSSYKGQRPQLQRLGAGTEMVTVTIGGNDVGFSNVLLKCFVRNCVKSGRLAEAQRDIERLGGELEAAYRSISDEILGPVISVGYPRLFPLGNERCVWLRENEKDGLNELGRQLNRTMAAAAAAAGTRFVSVLDVLAGHELCTRDPYVYKLGPLGGQKRGHPLAPGQRLIAIAVEKALFGG